MTFECKMYYRQIEDGNQSLYVQRETHSVLSSLNIVIGNLFAGGENMHILLANCFLIKAFRRGQMQMMIVHIVVHVAVTSHLSHDLDL